MLKVIVLLCMLLQANAACAPGAGACDAMDESALVQKDMLLAQKRALEPTDVDRQIAAKHISEGLSLQYLLKGSNAKLESAQRMFEVIRPLHEKIPGALDKYGKSEHTKEDFDTFREEATNLIGEAVSVVDSETKAAEEDLAKAKEELMMALDNMEEQTKFAELVSRYAAASQVASQGQFTLASVKDAQKTIKTALKRNEKYSEGGFKQKVYERTDMAMRTNAMSLTSSIVALIKIDEEKVEEIKDASKKYTSHSMESLNDAMFQLVALDKQVARTALAKQVGQSFAPIEGKLIGAIGLYSGSKHTEEDWKAFRATLEQALEETTSAVKTQNAVDKKKVEELRSSLVATFDKLADVDDFANQVMQFATVWGTERLQTDMLKTIEPEIAKVTDAMSTYEADKDGNKDEAFGKVYQSVIGMMLAVKSSYGQWSVIGDVAVDNLQQENVKLQSFMAQ